MPTAVWALRWTDVDPATRAFDEGAVRAIVKPLLSAPLTTSEARRAAEDRIDRALLAELGHWVAGWRWAASEPGCGGPVRAYCCADHSLKRSPDAMREVVVGAVRAWRGRIVEMSALFMKLREEAAGLDIDEAASRAATSLLPVVLEWTGAEDAWYSTYERVLAWYLESLLGESDRTLTLVVQAIGGRFQSWLEPDKAQAEAVCRDIGASFAQEAVAEPTHVDSLREWLGEREKIRWGRERICHPEPVSRDGHQRFIDTLDSARSPERARRMSQALEAARRAAHHDIPLTFDLIRQWQSLVLGTEVEFRDGVAFSHGGAERYGLDAHTRRRFDQCLAEATESSLPSVVRAARVYLDVCYFHPFPDGNARAARLALDYVLTRDGLALHAAEPIFLVARRVGDKHGVYGFIYVVDYLAGAANLLGRK
ncbi:MAG TPA: Fic family protein [Polyangiaceae bacterium]|nr:Fic family protein [Polyangiaceae bacterium]